MRTLGIALLTAVLGFAQLIGPPNPLPSSLATYLDLTATQNARLQQNRVELQRFYNEKSRREAVVRGEIALETNKPVVDPMALGLRYLELEAICRESQAAYDKNRTDNLALLNDAQKVKLRALDDVIKLIPVVYEAQAANLIPGGSTGIASLGGVIGGGLIGGLTDLIGSMRTGPGCSSPIGIIPAGLIGGAAKQ